MRTGFVTLILIVLFIAGAMAQQTDPGVRLTDEQQAEFQQAQRNVVDAQKALDLAVAQRIAVVYKIRSEVGAPESKYEARLVGEQLAFIAVPKPTPTPVATKQ